MSKIINKYLLEGYKFMHAMHLRQPGKPGFTCSACESFTKNKERILKFYKRGDSRCIS